MLASESPAGVRGGSGKVSNASSATHKSITHDEGLSPPLLPYEELQSIKAVSGDVTDTQRRGSCLSVNSTEDSIIAPAPTSEDLNDPSIEMFPGTKAAILHRIRTMQSEVPTDNPHTEDTLERSSGMDKLRTELLRLTFDRCGRI